MEEVKEDLYKDEKTNDKEKEMSKSVDMNKIITDDVDMNLNKSSESVQEKDFKIEVNDNSKESGEKKILDDSMDVNKTASFVQDEKAKSENINTNKKEPEEKEIIEFDEKKMGDESLLKEAEKHHERSVDMIMEGNNAVNKKNPTVDEVKPAEEIKQSDLNVVQQRDKLIVALSGIHVKKLSELSNKSQKYLERQNIKKLHELFTASKSDSTILSIQKECCGTKFTEDEFKQFFDDYKQSQEVLKANTKDDATTLNTDALKNDLETINVILEKKGVSRDSVNILMDTEKGSQKYNDLISAIVTNNQKEYQPVDTTNHQKEIIAALQLGKMDDLSPEQKKAFNYVPKVSYYSTDEKPVPPKDLMDERNKMLEERTKAKLIVQGAKPTPENLDKAIKLYSELKTKYNTADLEEREEKLLQNSILVCKDKFAEKGLDTKLVDMASETFGTPQYEKYRDEIIRNYNAMPMMNTPHKTNIDDFYNRIGKVFDAEHNKTGSDLSKENLLETAKVLRDINAYKAQLERAIHEDIHDNNSPEVTKHTENQSQKGAKEHYLPMPNHQVDYQSAELHFSNIKKFLLFKGVPEATINDLVSCSDKELEGKTQDFMATIQKDAVQKKGSSASLDGNDLRIHISIDIGGEEKEIEEVIPFDKIKNAPAKEKVSAPKETKVESTQEQDAAKIDKMLKDYKNKYGKEYDHEEHEIKEGLAESSKKEIESNDESYLNVKDMNDEITEDGKKFYEDELEAEDTEGKELIDAIQEVKN